MRIARLLAVALVTLAAACSGGSHADAPSPPPAYDAAALPPGPVGAEIAAGRDLIEHTKARMPSYVGARMNCSACHLGAGTVPRGGTLIGAAARFPQYNKRAGRVIALQDRIAECFLYSMNGRPPAYDGKEMIAIVAYIAWLSRATPAFSTPDPQQRFALPVPSASPDAAAGARLFAARCASCHQASGEGIALAVPPLWGPQSFNAGAGLHRLGDMAGFIRYNMPQNAPGTLSDRDAFAIAAFVLSHPRPAFARDRIVAFPPRTAGYF